MASDPATNTVVTFGGADDTGQPLADTWTWDGTDWTQRHPATQPQARFANMMAFGRAPGSHRQAVVLFGGFGGGVTEFNDLSKLLGDTWTWDGTDWTMQHPAHQPIPRRFAGLAADPVTHILVLFGGGAPDSLGNVMGLHDTWIYAPTSVLSC